MGCGAHRFDSEISADKFADLFNPKYFIWKYKLKSPIWTLLSGATPASNVEIRAKLPKLEIKRFDGRMTEWQAFIDCFDSAVHSNPKLSNIDKINYLKSLVEGPAAASIKGLPLTLENYNSARKILEERYGNKQLIICSHINNLLNLPVVSSVNDVKGIRQLYDISEACNLWV